MAGPAVLPSREGYALWAGTWDATPSPIVAAEERAMRPWIERLAPRFAVDAGCGTGRWIQHLPGIGIDSSAAMLGVAAQKARLRGRLAVGDACNLPVASGRADLVLCTLTLGHVRARDAAVHEFARVLERGGTLLLSDFHPDAFARGWRRTFRHQGRTYELEHYPYTAEDIERAGAGLVLEEKMEVSIGEAERELFVQAGRPELFEAACTMPAVLLSRWTGR
jgi:ubiquinone/menaquinone biosynthesis C-methylase UbiE